MATQSIFGRAAARRLMLAAWVAAGLGWALAPIAPTQAAPDAPSAPGQLDLTLGGFGAGGIVAFAGLKEARDIALQPDGKILAVGSDNTHELSVRRLLPNGQPDLLFGVNGQAVFPDMFAGTELALQSDGRIVVGGTRTSDFQVARLTPAGALDLEFDGDGWVSDNDSQLRQLNDLLVQPDGKIVAVGVAEVGGDDDFAVIRYTPTGARDEFFGGGDGKVTIPFGSDDWATSVALYAGKLVVGGSKGISDFAIARLEPTGLLDNDDGDGGFDGDGKLTTSFDTGVNALVVQPDGKIIALGYRRSPSASYVARYLSTGALDGTFGSGGQLTIPVDQLHDLALQLDGKIVLLGSHTSPGGDNKFALHRLNSDGVHDPAFGPDQLGIVFHDFGHAFDIGFRLALQPDGRILANGRSGDNAMLIRLWSDGLSYDSGGQQTHALLAPPVYPVGSDVAISALAVQSEGKYLVAGELIQPNQIFSDAFVTRFLIDGQVDTGFGDQGTARLAVGPRNAARAIALQPDGKILIAGYADWGHPWADFMVARFHPNGAPDTTFGLNGNAYRLVDFAGPPDYGTDYGYALAVAPGGKIVVAGQAWNGSSHVWGVARWNSSGVPDTTFDTDGKVLLDFGPGSGAHAVVVQPDGKLILGGRTAYDDFAVARLLENGAPDEDFNAGLGFTVTDMGGVDNVTSLALAPTGWFYAAGYSWRGGQDDFALAQYTPDGQLAACPAGETCAHWPEGKRFVSLGGSDSAYALALRGDDQLVAAGCSDWHLAAAQVSTTTDADTPLVFKTQFGGHFDCAFGVQFSGVERNKVVTAGLQSHGTEGNLALARFETTAEAAPSPTPAYSIFVPLLHR